MSKKEKQYIPFVKEGNVWREIRTLFPLLSEIDANRVIFLYQIKGFKTKIEIK